MMRLWIHATLTHRLLYLLIGCCLSYTTMADQISNNALPEIEAYSEISQRPLFHSTRRPKPKSQNGGSDSQGDLHEKWRLSGIVTHENEPVALFADRSGKTNVRLTVGMPLDQQGVLSEVGTDFALVDDNGESIRFELWEPRDRSPVKPPVTAENGTSKQPKISPRARIQPEKVDQAGADKK
ncbi:hypothetical protein [uncultured Neptuniibacter sp.]|uniref:hypothetical protein n=1 Tax=uncultured Neptuniibacter sp. TaxID=502143 RepID=UPI0026238C99|nr:hypothetical protein [uncultured Neptuniibacter sp.]